MTYNPPYDNLPFAQSDAEARTGQVFRNVDPFPDIDPALLWEKHFIDYVRVTGMLYPFFPSTADGQLKSASYEAHPGGSFIRWTPEGRKVVEEIKPGEKKNFVPGKLYQLYANRIHDPAAGVYRSSLQPSDHSCAPGTVAGTGPLVDPQFEGNLLDLLPKLPSFIRRVCSGYAPDRGVLRTQSV